jgi:uncharacterized Fe-S center protein
MSEAVYFWNLRASRKAPVEAKVTRMRKLAGLGAELRSGDLTAVKLHFGEGGARAITTPAAHAVTGLHPQVRGKTLSDGHQHPLRRPAG